MRLPVKCLRLAAVVLLAATTACAGKSGSSGDAAASAVPAVAAQALSELNGTGLYSGTVEDSGSGLGAVSLQVVRYNGTANGSGEIVDDQGFSPVTLSGTVSGKTLDGTITVQTSGCVYDVALTLQGRQLNGSYTPTGSCSNSGTTAMKLLPTSFDASGKYAGTFVDETDGTQASIKLQLTQSGSGLTGEFTTKDPFGKGSGTLSGTLSGAVATVGIQVAGDSCSPYNATLIAYGKSFYGYYSSTVCTLVGYISVKK